MLNVGSVECSVQMFRFFLHNHKSYLLLSVSLIGHNLSRSCKTEFAMYYLCFSTTVVKERRGICVISGKKVFNLTN